eukprot:3362044-Rhodomonas_salina.1
MAREEAEGSLRHHVPLPLQQHHHVPPRSPDPHVHRHPAEKTLRAFRSRRFCFACAFVPAAEDAAALAARGDWRLET